MYGIKGKGERGKVNFTVQWAVKAQRGLRGMALLFL